MSESGDIIFTIAYLLMAICFVAPPTEFVSAGLTIQNLLGSFLGSENLFFVQYHLKRTTTTLFVHSMLPLGYYVGMGFLSADLDLFDLTTIGFYWGLFLAVCLTLPIAVGVLAAHWSRNNWKCHPIAQSLGLYADNNSSWHAVASNINIEFRRMDKFTTGPPGRRVIVTDSWIMKTTAYYVHIALQSDVHLTLTSTDEHDLALESSTGVQYINIHVRSIDSRTEPFKIRLNAVEYNDLKEKIRGPIRVARDVVIHQTLSDRFLQVFAEQVNLNAPYQKPHDMELEHCVGCMQKRAEIKLRKLCNSTDQGVCVSCYCRPMWCLECMGKWFASRQNQNEPQTWLSSRCHCPTCRSMFCMLDVCLVI